MAKEILNNKAVEQDNKKETQQTQSKVDSPTQSNAPDTPVTGTEIYELLKAGDSQALLDLALSGKAVVVPVKAIEDYEQQKADLDIALQTASGLHKEIAAQKDKIIPLLDVVDKNGKPQAMQVVANLGNVMNLFKSFNFEKVFSQKVMNRFIELSKRYPDAFPTEAMQELIAAFKAKFG